jgi:hypothetical protein
MLRMRVDRAWLIDIEYHHFPYLIVNNDTGKNEETIGKPILLIAVKVEMIELSERVVC